MNVRLILLAAITAPVLAIGYGVLPASISAAHALLAIADAGATEPAAKLQRASGAPYVVTAVAGVNQAQAALAVSARQDQRGHGIDGSRLSGRRIPEGSLTTPADPGLYDSRLNDYQLERDSCCESMHE